MVEGVLLILQGGQGGEEEATAARAPRRQAAAVIPLSPQLKMVLTVGTHCQGFILFPFLFYFQQLWTFN